MPRAHTVYDGESHHPIDHLAPFQFTYARPAKGSEAAWEKEISVTFSWHCYTRKPESHESVYRLRNGTEVRCFCPNRYTLSFHLPEIIRQIEQKPIFQTGKGNFVTVEIVDQRGQSTDYGVFFSVTRGEKQAPLKLRIESAYPFTETDKKFRVSKQRIRFGIIVHNKMKNKPIKLRR